METLILRYTSLQKSLSTLRESLELIHNQAYEEIYESLRDSVIKRFEYSMDTFWKYLKQYLEIGCKISVSVASPKFVLRSCLNQNLIIDHEFTQLLSMVDDRNLTSHAYNEMIAEEISTHIEPYYQIMHTITLRLSPTKISL
jgi:nucleotidyltransferase substrate binding protein (TIGR01987 family)